MIPIPHGWGVIEKGSSFLLVHPAGAAVAALRYCERAGRPKRLGELVGELVAKLPDMGSHSIGPVDRFITDDGEHAATISITTGDATRSLHVHAAYVFTDDFYSALVGICSERSTEIRHLVRELAQQDNHALGVRRRRFDYTPPAGWQPLRRGLSTSWIPPDYPRNEMRLLVYPANPMPVVGRAVFGGVHLNLEDAGWEVIEAAEARTGTTRMGLAYEAQDVVCRRDGATRLQRIVVARDALYQYPLELWSARQSVEGRAVIDAVLHSIRPLAAAVETTPELLEHWAD